MPAINALDSGNPDSEDESKKADRLAARAARFNNKLAGNRYKELEEARTRERRAYENQGLITAGKTELGEAVDMRGTCERMCSDYEAEFREFTGEVHPLEARDSDRRRIDHAKAVAAYTRSDAGAGHGEAAKLPSDLRTPTTLVTTLDYLFSSILPTQPTMPAPAQSTPRTALGYTAGFIRDRTRAIRKEFAMQSSWGHAEAIESFERIARWHILCLRELQEETGMNTDMHIDSAELGRCFTSLRQHYNDRREETGLDMPCPNEPEFRAYMLIFDLTQKAVAISTAEVPSIILDHPNVQLAWQIRRAAQRNFDSQKEGSKQNAELGANIITAFVKYLKQAKAPYLLSCLVEIRLREMRRSALRALQRTYPRLKTEAIRRNEDGQIVERRMVLMKTFESMMGCEEQEKEGSAWDDIDPVSPTPEAEAVEIARKFGLEVFEDNGKPIGVIINLGSYFDDNKDAPYTRRWKLITDKRQNIPYTDIINAKAGVLVDGTAQPVNASISQRSFSAGPSFRAPLATQIKAQPAPQPNAFSFSSSRPVTSSSSAPAQPVPGPSTVQASQAAPASTAFSFSFAPPTPAATPPTLSTTPTAAAPPSQFQFSFGRATDPLPAATSPAPPPIPAPAQKEISLSAPSSSTVPGTSTLPATANPGPSTSAAKQPSFFSTPAVAGPSTLPSSAQLIPILPTTAPAGPTVPNSLGASTSTATPRKSSLRSSLTRSVSRPKASPDDEKRRHQQRALVDPVASLLIDEILGSLVRRITPEVERTINSQKAAVAYYTRKTQRKQLISLWSSSIFDSILDDLINDVSKRATLREIAKRSRLRQSVSHWRGWTREREEQRESAVRDRADIWLRLKGMGLGGEERSIRDSMAPPGSERMEEMELDVGLHEAERLKEHFYSPSSFLHTIARQVSPILNKSSQSRSATAPRFQILLSTSADSASPPPSAASKWLIDKITPKNTEGEWWACEGVEYACPVRSRYDEMDEKDLGRLGLVLLEVPMTSALKAERDKNAGDVQDRLSAILDVTSGSGIAYTAPLIILTWHEETLDEFSDRLDLSYYLSQFGHVGVMCLSQVDNLDVRFGDAVREALSGDIRREQLILQMGDVVSMILQPWQKLLDSADLLLQQHSENANLALHAFKAGIVALSHTSELVKTWMNSVTSQDRRSPFEPLLLPDFSLPDDVNDISLAVVAVEEYLQSDLFTELQDVLLIGSTLHPAAMTRRPLPISALLANIATFALGELSAISVQLEIFGTTEYITSQHADFINTVSEGFTSHIEQTLGRLSSLVPAQTATEDFNETVSTSRSSRSLKRSASTQISPVGSKESKGKKNARLLKAIREVERSLGELSAGTDGDDEAMDLAIGRAQGEMGMSY